MLFITQKGIFVIENKNYSGWIFGNESDRYWTVSCRRYALSPNAGLLRKLRYAIFLPSSQNAPLWRFILHERGEIAQVLLHISPLFIGCLQHVDQGEYSVRTTGFRHSKKLVAKIVVFPII